MRLQHWKEDMHTRGGASAWQKRRVGTTCGLRQVLHWDVATPAAGQNPITAGCTTAPLSPEATQCSTAAELATRWNAGLAHYQRDTGRPPQLSKIAGDAPRLQVVEPARSRLVPTAFPARCLSTTFFASELFNEELILFLIEFFSDLLYFFFLIDDCLLSGLDQ